MSFVDSEVTAAQAICDVLEQAGIDFVIGMPGGDVMHIFDALYDRRKTIRTVLVRDEVSAGIMAEAYGRKTGRPAVVLAQGVWLLSNAALGAIEALTGSSPVIYLTDLSDKIPWSHHSPTQTGTGHYGNWDSHLAFRGFMKEVMEAHDPIQAVQLTQLAIKHATVGSPGPVCVVYYGGALKGKVGPASRPALHASAGYLVPDLRQADEASLARAVELLGAAKRPTIIAGNGVRFNGGTDALLALAETLSAPVVSTSAGKSVMAEHHALAAGVVGDYGLEAAATVLGEADVVLAVGTRLAPGDTLRQHPGLLDVHRQTLIQIDIEPRNVGWTHPVQCGLIGDAGTVMKELAARLKKKSISAADGAARVQSAAKRGFFESAESTSDAVPILPQRLIRELGAALPANALVTSDAGENRIFMVHHFRSQSVNSYFQPGSTGGMGYAVPAALGVKLAHPDLPVVAVCGDGGFAMSLSGLMTALEEKLPITVVVMNNAMLGWVAHVQGERRIASHLGRYDYAAIARAIGCRGVRVENPANLRAALSDAMASNEVTVVEVMTSPEQTWEQVVCKVSAAGS